MTNNLRSSSEITLLDACAPRAITSSTNASPIVITDAAHGLSTGDHVCIFGHATNTAANGMWEVTWLSSSTFSLTKNLKSGLISTGNGVGGATGTQSNMKSVGLNVAQYRNIVLSFDTDGGGDAAMTVKVAGTGSKDIPDFAQSQSVDNHYDYVLMVDYEDRSDIDGDTGFVVATADDHRQFEVNTNGLEWICVYPTAGTAGEVTVTARGFTNS